MSARRSLKDQLAELSQPAPVDLDPEEALAGDDPSEHRWSIDHSAARQHYIDVAPSTLRKLHESVSDPKYDGVRTSRKKLYEDSDGENEPGEDADVRTFSDEEADEDLSEAGTEEDKELRSPHEDETSQDESGIGSEDESSQSPRTPHRQVNEAFSRPSNTNINDNGAPEKTQPEGDIASNLRVTHEADKRKGRAVSRQIALWDTLLDARIQLQKAVTAANRLPLPSESARYTSHPHARDALDGLLNVASSLTEELLTLQGDLLHFNESIETPPRKRRRLDALSESDPAGSYGTALQELSASASALEAAYHPWLVDTLSKWSAKVQAVAPNVLLPDARGSFMRDGKSGQIGVVSLIDDTFRSDGTKLLDRTRKRKDKHVRIGQHRPTPSEDGDGRGDAEDREEQPDMDVFDDTDYYQQLLRDVIAARGGSDGQGGEAQWQIQQRERRAKRKKTVDTKASKGRKLRYEVHAKLQNFMVPVPVVGGEWHEEQIDGLFSSLLQT
ncbi:TRAUB-domain-containing protein [Dichomitus squalens LYAD-421 SS1]|uniref:Protein BFR2 n=1 Tax=Dichomitus squalens TaxID=114155 RepID=A0A4Q9Q1E9_9APHY|nr:TRAUB-domain-containing protein [Dichomitus squalens LYAD-421 SS1]EJF64176.1 TRAUB-domain-containing protein [Dichomitus squalens LYAD-421 SS1]TBU60899.1 TRAUB-domain-containing protein [Dichomitus squalens]